MLEPSIETEKGLASESRLKSRLPAITPSCEAPEPSIENQQLPSPEEVINAQLQQPCPKAFQSRSQIMVAALLCSFSMVLGGLIGAFACYTPGSQNSDNTAAKTVDPQPPSVIADRSVTAAPRLQPAAAPKVTLPLLTEPSVEEVRQDEEVEFIDEVLQIAQEANQEQEVQLAADKMEAQMADEEEAAALVARVTKLLGKPIGNVDSEDIPNDDRPVIKKPIKIVGIQKLDANQLRAMLLTETASVGLFESILEFEDAKRYINARKTFDFTNLFPNLFRPNAQQKQEIAKVNEPGQAHFDLLGKHLLKRKDLQALPLAMGDHCRVSDKEANAIELVSNKLGRLISEASGGARAVLLRNSGNAAVRNEIKEQQDRALEKLRALVNSDSHPQYLKTGD